MNLRIILLLTIFLSSSLLAKRKIQIIEVSKKDFEIHTSLGKFPVVVGKVPGDKEKEGDRKTPEGIYFVTHEIPKSQLTEEHGRYAFALSFPNTYDLINKVSGSNIWFHGVRYEDRTDLKQDTRGCVALRNSDLEKLKDTLRQEFVLTRIWKDSIPSSIPEFDMKLFKDWIAAWNGKDFQKFASYIHPDFKTPEVSRAKFLAQKEYLFKINKNIQVLGNNPIAFYHPKYSIVIFQQAYKSDIHTSTGTKILYWKDGKIISEQFTQNFNIMDVEPQLADQK